MNLLLMFTMFTLLSITIKSQNDTQCRGIYHEEPLDISALDVCAVSNTVWGAEFPISSRYVCENDEVYNHYWYGDGCSGNPESEARVDTEGAVCEGLANCPYAIIRVYAYNKWADCDDYDKWSDRANMVNICELSTNASDNIGSLKLECDKTAGVIRNTYSGESCADDNIMGTTIIFPSGNDNTNTCVMNHDGLMAKFISCNERKNATTPIPTPTSAPTPRPSAGGTYPPSAAPTYPPDDAWFITSLVFICLFGVLLCGMVWLAFFVMDDRNASTYSPAPTDEEAGVETTNYN